MIPVALSAAIAVIGFIIGFLYGVSRREDYVKALAYGIVTAIILPIVVYLAAFSLALLIIAAIVLLILYIMGGTVR